MKGLLKPLQRIRSTDDPRLHLTSMIYQAVILVVSLSVALPKPMSDILYMVRQMSRVIQKHALQSISAKLSLLLV